MKRKLRTIMTFILCICLLLTQIVVYAADSTPNQDYRFFGNKNEIKVKGNSIEILPSYRGKGDENQNAVVLKKDFTDYGSYQIDFDLDISEGNSGDVGLSIGIPDMNMNPCYKLISNGKFMFGMADVRKFINGNDINGKRFSKLETKGIGVYHLRVIGIVKDTQTKLQFYFDDMNTPYYSCEIDGRMPAKYIGVFASKNGTGHVATVKFNNISIKSLDNAYKKFGNESDININYKVENNMVKDVISIIPNNKAENNDNAVINTKNFDNISPYSIDIDVKVPKANNQVYNGECGISIGLPNTEVSPSCTNIVEGKYSYAINQEGVKLYKPDGTYELIDLLINSETNHIRIEGNPSDDKTIIKFYINDMSVPMHTIETEEKVLADYIGFFATQNIDLEIEPVVFSDLSVTTYEKRVDMVKFGVGDQVLLDENDVITMKTSPLSVKNENKNAVIFDHDYSDISPFKIYFEIDPAVGFDTLKKVETGISIGLSDTSTNPNFKIPQNDDNKISFLFSQARLFAIGTDINKLEQIERPKTGFIPMQIIGVPSEDGLNIKLSFYCNDLIKPFYSVILDRKVSLGNIGFFAMQDNEFPQTVKIRNININENEKYLIRGNAPESIDINEDTINLNLANVKCPHSWVVLDKNYSTDDYNNFQITFEIDPINNSKTSSVDSNVGISFGMENNNQDPFAFKNDGKIISINFKEGVTVMRGDYPPEKSTKYTILQNGKDILNPTPPQNIFWPNARQRLDVTYKVKIIGTPKPNDPNKTILKLYVDDMDKTIDVVETDFPIKPKYIGAYASKSSDKDGDLTATIKNIAVKPITGEKALHEPTRAEVIIKALNLDYEGLEEVKEITQTGNYEYALSKYITYKRNVKKAGILNNDPTKYGGDKYLEIANYALEGKYSVGAAGYKSFILPEANGGNGNKIDWSGQIVKQDPGQLLRHTHWPSLAKVYEETGEEKYIERINFEINDWFNSLPIISPVSGVIFSDDVELKYNSIYSGNMGRRIQYGWAPVYESVRKYLSEEAHEKMIYSFLMNARANSNPTTFMIWDDSGMDITNAMLFVAMMFPEFEESQTWIDIAKDRLFRASDGQIYPDGSHVSLSTGYGWAFGIQFAATYRFANAFNNFSMIPEGLTEKMIKYYDAMGGALARPGDPDGAGALNVMYNDGMTGNMDDKIGAGLVYDPDNEEFKYFKSKGKVGTKPTWTSRYLPYAGWMMMRTGWGLDKPQSADKYLQMDAGPLGASHAKQDKLNIYAALGNKLMLMSTGRGKYDTSPQSAYAGRNDGFNLVTVDGNVQIRGLNDITKWTPEERRWITNDKFDYGEGFFTDTNGWKNGKKAYHGTHTRQIISVKGDNAPDTNYFIVIDTMNPGENDVQEHEYSALFHLGTSGYEELDNGGIKSVDNSGTLSIIPLEPNGVTVENQRGIAKDKQGNIRKFAQDDSEIVEYIQGWYNNSGLKMVPIHTPVFKWKATGPSTKAWLITMTELNETDAITNVENIADEDQETVLAKLTRADGGFDYIMRRSQTDSETPIELGNTSIIGDVAVVRETFEGEVLDKLGTSYYEVISADDAINDREKQSQPLDIIEKDMPRDNVVILGDIDEIHQGEEVKVPVKIISTTPSIIGSFDIDITYDEDVLTFNKINFTDCTTGEYKSTTPGVIQINGVIEEKQNNEDTVIAELIFTVSDESKEGESLVEINKFSILDIYDNQIPYYNHR